MPSNRSASSVAQVGARTRPPGLAGEQYKAGRPLHELTTPGPQVDGGESEPITRRVSRPNHPSGRCEQSSSVAFLSKNGPKSHAKPGNSAELWSKPDQGTLPPRSVDAGLALSGNRLKYAEISAQNWSGDTDSVQPLRWTKCRC